MPHSENQLTRIRLARHNRRFSRFTAKLPAGFDIESQFPFQFLRLDAVALVAMLGEHRPDFLLEKLDAIICAGHSDKPQQRCAECNRQSKER